MQLERSPYTSGEKGYICWDKTYFKFKAKDYQIGKFLPNDKTYQTVYGEILSCFSTKIVLMHCDIHR